MKRKVTFKILISVLFAIFFVLVKITTFKVNAGGNGEAAPTVKYETNLSTYYQSLESLKGQELIEQIAVLMNQTHKTYTSYNEVKGGNAYSDEDPDNPSNIILFYSGVSISNTWNANTWNREHIWCKSLSGGLYTNVGDSTRNAGTDLHQLRPASTPVNTSRNNKPYAELYHTGTNVTYNGVETNNYSRDNLFEPRDEIKGDVARMLFYMYAHYSNEIATTNPAYSGVMKLENIVYTPVQSKEASVKLLLKWNHNDPVDDFEKKRNDYIASVQGNRNPFIDHPEFASMIFDESYNGEGALIDSDGIYTEKDLCLSAYNKELPIGSNYSLTTFTLPIKSEVTYYSSNSNIVSVENGTLKANNYGQAVIYTSTVIDEVTVSKECYVSVVSPKSGSSVYKNRQYRYVMASYPTGSQYASNEKHVLDENFTLFVDNGYFSTEIRMYASTKNDTTVYSNKLPSNIAKLVLNVGYGLNTLTVLGSNDGKNFSFVEDVKIKTKTNTDYTVDFSNYSYKYFKLDATENSNQIRVNEISLYYQEDYIVEDKLYLAVDNINPYLIDEQKDDNTLEIASFNNVIYEYNRVSSNDKGQLLLDASSNIYNVSSYGVIDHIVITSDNKFDVLFMDGVDGEPLDSILDRNGAIAPIVDCGYFKIISFDNNVVIDNLLVYYRPIATVKYQIDDNDNYRVVSEIKDLRNGKIGFEIDGEKHFVEQVKKQIIVQENQIGTQTFNDGYFFTYEAGKKDNNEHTVNAFVIINQFQTVYVEDRIINFE